MNVDREQMIEQRAKALLAKFPGLAYALENTAISVARAEIERERWLLKGVDDAIGIASRGIASGWSLESVKARLQMHRDEVRAAYEAEFAPKPRCVEDIARDIHAQRTEPITYRPEKIMVPAALMDELSAALSRKGGE